MGSTQPSDRTFHAEQFVPTPRPEVFAFFSEPANLEAITPAWLRFRVVARSTPEVRLGTELTYRLRLRGIPMTWVSRITVWEPGVRFTDVQVRGPYGKWEHAHTFRDHEGGTLLGDHVTYRLPLASLGDWIAGGVVAADIRRIFEFRRARIAETFGAGSASGRAPR